MASTLNMEQSSLKRKYDTLDPLPGPSRMGLCTDTYKKNIQPQSSLSPSTSGSPSRPSSPPILSLPDTLNNRLSKVLRDTLVYCIIMGKPHENTLYHCNRIKERVSEILAFTNDERPHSPYRDQLLTLLMSCNKQFIKDIPANDCEWNKLLQLWCRKNQCEDDIGERKIYHILAVDGFRGFLPKSLKYYLVNVLVHLRLEYQYHVRGIRAMYEYFEEDEKIKSLTGTDSSRIVFLALLELYIQNGDLLSDDQISAKIYQNRRHVEGVIYQRSIKYRDLKNVDCRILKTLSEKYLEQWLISEEWKVVARELLKILEIPNAFQVKIETQA